MEGSLLEPVRPHRTWNLSRKAGDVFNSRIQEIDRSKVCERTLLQISMSDKISYPERLSKLILGFLWMPYPRNPGCPFFSHFRVTNWVSISTTIPVPPRNL